jgi:hypothetical protein
MDEVAGGDISIADGGRYIFKPGGTSMASLKYPECRQYRGRDKVYCLILGIVRDYSNGAIDRETAKRRLRYLIALNKANGWMPDKEARLLVERWLEKVEPMSAVGGRRRRRRAAALAR